MLTAIFDGKCVICQSTRRAIKALDWLGRVAFADLHDQESWQTRFPAIDEAGLMGEIHVIDARGEVFAGFHASRRMLKEVPLGFPIWLLLAIPGVDAFGVRVYRLVARNRYGVNRFFGRSLPDCADDACAIPQ